MLTFLVSEVVVPCCERLLSPSRSYEPTGVMQTAHEGQLSPRELEWQKLCCAHRTVIVLGL